MRTMNQPKIMMIINERNNWIAMNQHKIMMIINE